MKAPAFWSEPPGFAAALLGPVAILYGAAAKARMRREGARAAVPVICIGNVTLGGAGKTPAALAVAALLRAMGRTPAFLSRGHGGRLAGPLLVRPGRHGFAEVGDEPLLLARHGLAVVSRDRPAGAALAVAAGADAIVMDDGLQNPSLRKDLAVAVFDGAAGTGNGRVFPAGPLRAPLGAQWPLIDAVLLVGQGRAGDAVAAEAERRGLPVLRAALVPDPRSAAALRGRRVLAFAGIGRPEKFFDSLRALGAEVVRGVSFPDHHPYSGREVAGLLEEARREGLVPVTTEKDHLRLPPGTAEPVATLPVTLRFEAEERAAALLARAFERRGG